MRFYAGIGSRETPLKVMNAMFKLARKLNSLGFTLRSGGADGADLAFERGAVDKEIFLPWKKFNGNPSNLHEPNEEAIKISRMLFPHFPGVSHAIRKLISRNMQQVMGEIPHTSSRSEFIICWTKDGKASGGTGYAIKAANYFDIPVYNLFNEVDTLKLAILLEQLEEEMEL